MKEILFRGKNRSGKQIEGSLVRGIAKFDNKPTTFIYELNTEIDGRGWIGNYFGEEVDPKTVMQFTNCIDRNGNKIFEGDIVKVYGYIEDNGANNSIAIVVDNSTLIEDGLGRWRPQDTVRLEIIGNIFDNLELLSERSKRWVKNYLDCPEDCYDLRWN